MQAGKGEGWRWRWHPRDGVGQVDWWAGKGDGGARVAGKGGRSSLASPEKSTKQKRNK